MRTHIDPSYVLQSTCDLWARLEDMHARAATLTSWGRSGGGKGGGEEAATIRTPMRGCVAAVREEEDR